MNEAKVSGALTRDAEIRFVGNTMLCEFTLAVDAGTRWDPEKQERVPKTAFVTVQAWAELAKHIADDLDGLMKGDVVAVIGFLDQYKSERRDTPSTRVVAQFVQLQRRHQQPGTGQW